MKPTVGRIVYYKSYGSPNGEFKSEDRAAIITYVHNDDVVDLCVLNPTGMFFNQRVSHDFDGRGGTWNWMPYQLGQAKKTEELIDTFLGKK